MNTAPAILSKHFGGIQGTELAVTLEKFWDKCAADPYIPPRPTKQQRARRRPSVSQAIKAAERAGKTVVRAEATRGGVKLTFAGETESSATSYWDRKLR
jgi:hypothetical protein